MTPDLISAVPNLGVGVAAILVLYLMFKTFIVILDKREGEMRALEKEVRTSIVGQLSSNSHVMNRMVDYLDRQDLHPAPRRNSR